MVSFSHTQEICQFMGTLKLLSAKLPGEDQALIFFSAPFLLSLKWESLFLFAALCIHLVCLNPDLSGALEKCNGSSSRASISLGVSRHLLLSQ